MTFQLTVDSIHNKVKSVDFCHLKSDHLLSLLQTVSKNARSSNTVEYWGVKQASAVVDKLYDAPHQDQHVVNKWVINFLQLN